jgi:hypothetical protein
MYPPPNGDVLVASQKEKRMKDKEKKAKQCKKKSSTKNHVEYGKQKTMRKNHKTGEHKNRNKDLIRMRRTQARSIPPLPLETTSSSWSWMSPT